MIDDLRRMYTDYVAEKAAARVRARARYRHLIERDIEEDVRPLRDELARALAVSGLSVREQQDIIGTRDWRAFKKVVAPPVEVEKVDPVPGVESKNEPEEVDPWS